MKASTSALVLSLVLAPAWAWSAPSDALLGAYNNVTRTPGFDNGLPEGSPFVSFSGSRTLNGARDVVTESNAVQSLTSVSVDQEHAQIHNYLSFSQPHALSTFPPDIIQDKGSLSAFAKFTGPGSDAEKIVLSMDFHGLFSGESTTDPELLLNGFLSLTVTDDLTKTAVDSSATAGLQFQHLPGNSVLTYDGSSTSGDGASFEVLSLDEDDLVGRLSITAWVKPGLYLILGGAVGATAVASGAPQQGVIDAWNTATLALSVPGGYAFDTNGATTFLNGALPVVTPTVPEPGSGLLILAGLAALGLGARRARRPVGPAALA